MNIIVPFQVLSRLRKLERAVSKSKRRLEKCLNSTQAEDKAEKCVRAVNEILESCLECKKIQACPQVAESVGVVVSKLENLLKDKMCELMERRRALAQEGRLDDQEKIRLVAERVAFESVILRRLKLALERSNEKSSGVLGDLVETSQLISNLECKVYGTKPKTYQNASYIQYLTTVLANRLVLVGAGQKSPEKTKEVTAAQSEGLTFLLQRQKECDQLVRKYKDAKLAQLAEALAMETLSLSEQEDQQAMPSSKLLEDRRIREAWALAQETVMP